MFKFINMYWEFVTRPPSTIPTPSGLELLPNFIQDSLIWTVIFSLFFIAIPFFIKNFSFTWYESLEKRKKIELPSYCVCLIHHYFMVPRAWIHVFNDFILPINQYNLINYSLIEAKIAPFCMGYLISDTLFYALPQLINEMKYEYIIHHILTIYLVYCTISSNSGTINRFIPHLLICDTTNIFFNTAWLLRLTSMKNSLLVTILELIFALSFLLTRVINLSCVFYGLLNHPNVNELGYAKYTLMPIALLQWFWFYKIMRTMIVRLNPSKKSKKYN